MQLHRALDRDVRELQYLLLSVAIVAHANARSGRRRDSMQPEDLNDFYL